MEENKADMMTGRELPELSDDCVEELLEIGDAAIKKALDAKGTGEELSVYDGWFCRIQEQQQIKITTLCQ